MAAAISHGAARASAGLASATAAPPADIAAPPADIAALPTLAAPPASAAPARRVLSIATSAAPLTLSRNAPELGKPSALVMRLSSAPCRFGPWLASSEDSEVALSPRSPMSFFRKASTIGTTIAIRFVAEDDLMPLEDESALTNAPLLSPKIAGTRLLVPAFMRSLTPEPPELNRLPML